MNTSNLITLISQTKEYDLHRQKINKIMKKNASTLDNRRQKLIQSYYTKRDKSNQYNAKLKQQAMERQNDLILKKIIQASNIRRSQTHIPHRSLSHNNLFNLKKSAQTINLQNNKLAQKLVMTQSKLAQDVVGETYKKHLQRKGRISKYLYNEQQGVAIPKKFASLVKLKKLENLGDVSRWKSSKFGKSKISQQNQQF